jgi:hypothetical protein
VSVAFPELAAASLTRPARVDFNVAGRTAVPHARPAPLVATLEHFRDGFFGRPAEKLSVAAFALSNSVGFSRDYWKPALRPEEVFEIRQIVSSLSNGLELKLTFKSLLHR